VIALQIYDSANKHALMADFTGRAEGVRFSTNRRGFSSLSVDRVPMSLHAAFALYEWRGTPHMVASGDGGGVGGAA